MVRAYRRAESRDINGISLPVIGNLQICSEIGFCKALEDWILCRDIDLHVILEVMSVNTSLFRIFTTFARCLGSPNPRIFASYALL
jgi:hypothetical protein